MKLWVGTSGYSYKEWKGSFYPEDLASNQMLAYYAERLPAVEINNTFYRLPKSSVLENWAEQVPDDFHFVLKASRKITHFKKLKDAGDETDYLVRTSESLGSKFGVILFQLPPYLRKDIDLLDAFLADLSTPGRSTFEFRHRSWFDDEVYERLRASGSALCHADADDESARELVATADWGYMRLRRPDYSDDDLREWAKRVKSQTWQEAYVFFKHEDEGAGPKLAMRFMDLMAEA